MYDELKRIRRLLSPAERKKGMQVAGAVFLSSLLDFAGLAVLLPILFYLLEGGGDRSAALWFCLAALVFVGLKNYGVIRLARFRDRFLLSLYRRFSFSLFTSYYGKGLLFIRTRGSVALAHEINQECYAFALGALAPLLHMAGEGLLVLFVTIALSAYDPLTAGMVYGVFIPAVGCYVRGVRKKLRRYGKLEQEAQREQSKLVDDALKGYAELELNAAFPPLSEAFARKSAKISECRLGLQSVQHLPACLSELAVITGLALLTAFGTGDIKAMVSIFAVAAFRLLPALKGILNGWTQVQNTLCLLPVIEEGMKEEGGVACAGPAYKLPFQKCMEVRSLSFAYPDGEEVLKDFSCTIHKGEFVCICGESGIGKSTLFNLLLGFLTPASGEIRIDGTLLTEEVRAAWHRRVGYVQQDVFIMDGTLAENIALGCRHTDYDKVRKVLGLVRLDTWADGLPQGMDTPMGEYGGRLSGGQKQRIGIARALYKEADVLFLDEATSALDKDTERAIHELLLHLIKHHNGLTILAITHRENLLACCHRVITLKTKK